MAYCCRRFPGLRPHFDWRVHHSPCASSFLSPCSFSSVVNFSNLLPPLDVSVPRESHVLGELSELLQISRQTLVSSKSKEIDTMKQVGGNRVVDTFLLPEDKLRGVFLQKLKGRAAIENALTSVDVDLSLDIVAKVVDKGNLSGEAMILFFRWAIKQPKVPKGVQSYHVILRALGRRKFFNFMMEVLREMGTAGVRPDLETIAIVIDSFVRAHHLRKAVNVFENLEPFGMQCDTESFNALLQALCRRLQVGAANSLFNEKKEKISFDRTTYNIIMRGWSKLGEVDCIKKIVKVMVAAGFNPDCTTYSCLIEGLGRAGRIDDAVEVFNRVEDNGCFPDASVYNSIISNFVAIGDCDECMRYYKKMLSDRCEPDLDTYTALISACLRARKVANALEMFEEMLGRNIIPTTGTVTNFLEHLCSYGPPHAAMVIYERARKVGCKISYSAYKLLLNRLSRFGKVGMLLNVWSEMQERGYPCDGEVYDCIINGLCNIGHMDNAVLVTEEALSRGFCPSRFICSKLNNKLLASKQADTAYKLFLKIKDARFNENARRYWRANGWHF